MVETPTQAALQQTGVRLTPQRLAIAGLLSQTGKEASAQEVYDRVRRRHPYIGRATVFRSLDRLVAAGLAQRLERPGHVSAYVWCEPGHHHHPICSACTGTPLAWATSSSRLANNSGRYMAASATSVIAPAIAVRTTSRVAIPRMVPNKMLTAVLAAPLNRARKSTPNPSDQAMTMPIVTSRPRSRCPNAPMTAPAAIVKTSRPPISG